MQLSRRKFLAATAASLPTVASLSGAEPAPEPIIDIHQHTNYSDRTNENLRRHQKKLGVTTTVLLPAGRLYGLDAKCGRNDTVVALTKERPEEFVYFANEITNDPEAIPEIRRYLKGGAIGIGEQKFKVACDSKELHGVAELAQEFGVPVLMHFQHEVYNTGIERFHKVLEKFPKVNFIGHAQTWWGNIDAKHQQKLMYPTGKITKGGISEKLLSDYPNMFGDLSAGSGLNALIRDEEHTRWFIDKHQTKLLYGSDCNDSFGAGPGCQGAQIMAAVRRLSPTKAIERKLLYLNAKQLLKLK